MYYGNLIGALYIFIIIMLSGELFEAVAFASENPDILLYMLVRHSRAAPTESSRSPGSRVCLRLLESCL